MNSSSPAGPYIYAVAWLLFAVLHSLLARPQLQRIIEKWVGRYYRLLYNLFALINILLVLEAGRRLIGLQRFGLFEIPGFALLSLMVQLLGFLVLGAALLYYDIGRFSGLTQLIKGEVLSASVAEPLQKNGLNRWVRHPLYTGALLLLWGGAVSPFALWTAVWGSLYLLIGSVFEERKLIRLYGDAYRQYQREVPRLVPTLRIIR